MEGASYRLGAHDDFIFDTFAGKRFNNTTIATPASVHDSIVYLDRSDRQRVRFDFDTQIVGLAGSEAAWQAANSGVPVHLYEMRPVRGTDAHKKDGLAELVCSNSFRSDD